MLNRMISKSREHHIPFIQLLFLYYFHNTNKTLYTKKRYLLGYWQKTLLSARRIRYCSLQYICRYMFHEYSIHLVSFHASGRLYAIILTVITNTLVICHRYRLTHSRNPDNIRSNDGTYIMPTVGSRLS